VISQAPVIFITGLSLSALVTWKVSQAFYRRHVNVLQANLDHYKALADSSRREGTPPLPESGLLTQQRRSKLIEALAAQDDKIKALAADRPPFVEVLSFMRFPYGKPYAEELISAIREAGIDAGWASADYQPFSQGRRQYLTGIWVMGLCSDSVAAALLEAGIEGVHIDPRRDLDETAEAAFIVIGELQR